MRLPVMVFGDLRAQLAACHIAERQFAELVARYGPEQTKQFPERDDRLCRAPDARRARASCPTANGASRTGSTTTASTFGKPIRLFVTIRKTGDQMVVDWTGTTPQVRGAINNTLSYTKSAVLHGRPLGAAAQHPQQRGRVPRHRGDLPAWHRRQRRAAGGLRRARADRLPHGRLHVRGARHDAARQGQGRRRRRQQRHLHRRLRRGPQALRLRRVHLRRLGRAALGRRPQRQLAHVRQHVVPLGRGHRGRAAGLRARLRVRARQGGRRQISRRRALPARIPPQRDRGDAVRCAPTARRIGPFGLYGGSPGVPVGELPEPRHREPAAAVAS